MLRLCFVANCEDTYSLGTTLTLTKTDILHELTKSQISKHYFWANHEGQIWSSQ